MNRFKYDPLYEAFKRAPFRSAVVLFMTIASALMFLVCAALVVFSFPDGVGWSFYFGALSIVNIWHVYAFSVKLPLLWVTCPNCESAWTGGHPSPESLKWCVLCGTGPKGPPQWFYRLPRFVRNRITARNFRRFSQTFTYGDAKHEWL